MIYALNQAQMEATSPGPAVSPWLLVALGFVALAVSAYGAWRIGEEDRRERARARQLARRRPTPVIRRADQRVER